MGDNIVRDQPLTVLVVCTGNSARSILGEALFNALGQGRVQGFSAGADPTGRVNPLALETLAKHDLPTEGFSSKSWNAFAAEDGPTIDVVITVCDSAANEACPLIRGAPTPVHWGVPDPAHIPDPTEARAAFEAVFQTFSKRVADFIAKSPTEMDDAAIRSALREVAEAHPYPQTAAATAGRA
ncbi:MAG: arsenate reductase ArsC [Pseudomonadota bacterium]